MTFKWNAVINFHHRRQIHFPVVTLLHLQLGILILNYQVCSRRRYCYTRDNITPSPSILHQLSSQSRVDIMIFFLNSIRTEKINVDCMIVFVEKSDLASSTHWNRKYMAESIASITKKENPRIVKGRWHDERRQQEEYNNYNTKWYIAYMSRYCSHI